MNSKPQKLFHQQMSLGHLSMKFLISTHVAPQSVPTASDWRTFSICKAHIFCTLLNLLQKDFRLFSFCTKNVPECRQQTSRNDQQNTNNSASPSGLGTKQRTFDQICVRTCDHRTCDQETKIVGGE